MRSSDEPALAVEAAVLDGLGEVLGADGVGPGEVGNRAGASISTLRRSASR